MRHRLANVGFVSLSLVVCFNQNGDRRNVHSADLVADFGQAARAPSRDRTSIVIAPVGGGANAT